MVNPAPLSPYLTAMINEFLGLEDETNVTHWTWNADQQEAVRKKEAEGIDVQKAIDNL